MPRQCHLRCWSKAQQCRIKPKNPKQHQHQQQLWWSAMDKWWKPLNQQQQDPQDQQFPEKTTLMDKKFLTLKSASGCVKGDATVLPATRETSKSRGKRLMWNQPQHQGEGNSKGSHQHHKWTHKQHPHQWKLQQQVRKQAIKQTPKGPLNPSMWTS